jgi:hypothetical protein
MVRESCQQSEMLNLAFRFLLLHEFGSAPIKSGMAKEPTWKLFLNWGVVVTFLSLPLVLMTIQLYIIAHPDVIPDPTKYRDHFKYLIEFQRNLAILVFGLAGLRTWEQIRNGNHSNGKMQGSSAAEHPR